MKKWSRRKRWLVGTTVCVSGLLLFLGGVFFGFINLFHAHEHCIKGTGLALRIYAEDHNDRLPYHTNGFGGAIVMFLKENPYENARQFTAPGDDDKLLKECVATGKHMPEEKCSRAYVQGLNEKNNWEIALVFDRYPTRGGDHFRRPLGPWLREAGLLDASMQVIAEENWLAFKKKQVDLLVAEGFSRERAEEFYKPMSKSK